MSKQEKITIDRALLIGLLRLVLAQLEAPEPEDEAPKAQNNAKDSVESFFNG